MWLELPNLWVGLLNGLGIPAAHLGISWWVTRMPDRWFAPGSFPFARFPFETIARYERGFRVGSWKVLLPDAGPWFGGFAKRRLRSADVGFLKQFRVETCRSEAAHWAQAVVIAAFSLWTPWPWAWIVIGYALASNLPCIILQRQNRLRLDKLIERAIRVRLARSGR